MKSIRKFKKANKEKGILGRSTSPLMPFSQVVENLLRQPCTMKFTGFCSSEHGSLGASGAWLDFCEDFCKDIDSAGNCSACSCSRINYLEINDLPIGVYSCWEFMLDAGGRVGLVIFDLDFNNAIIEAIRALRFEKELAGKYPEVNFSLINEWLRMPTEGISINHQGKIDSGKNPAWSEIIEDSGIIVIGDARQGLKSKAPLMTFDHFLKGEVQIFELLGTSGKKKWHKFGLLLSSNPGVETLGLVDPNIPPRYAYNFVLSGPPLGIPSNEIACSWLNSQVKTCELESMEITEAPDWLQAMIMMEKNSWILMHQAIETGIDFEVALNEAQPNLSENWKTMIKQFRGQI